jgi:hypothetical protein
LVREGAVNLSMLLEIADQLPSSTLVLRERAAAISSTIVAYARRYAAATQDAEASRLSLATALTNLANRLRDVGQREAALMAAQEAVRLYRQLVAWPEVFRPNLARSLRTMGQNAHNMA